MEPFYLFNNVITQCGNVYDNIFELLPIISIFFSIVITTF